MKCASGVRVIGQVRPPDDQVGRVPPVTGLRYVGLVAERLGGGDRHVRVPVVERQDRPADQRQEPRPGRIGHHRHGRDRGKPGHPVRPDIPIAWTCEVDQLGSLRPGGADAPALPAERCCTARRAGSPVISAHAATGSPSRARAARNMLEEFPAHVREAHPGGGVGVPGERCAARQPRGSYSGDGPVDGSRPLGLPGDGPVLDVHLPRARPGQFTPCVERTTLSCRQRSR